MGIWNEYPYTDFHELNDDWIIKQVKSNAVKIEDLNNTVSDLTERLDNLDLQAEVDNKIDRMAASGELTNLFDDQYITPHNVILVADSYGTTSGDGINTVEPYTERIKSFLETYYNWNVYISAENGSGFSNGRFLSHLQSIANQITDPIKIDTILVAGGTNDINQPNTDISSGMTYFMNYVKSAYPNAKVRLAWLGWRRIPHENRSYNDLYTAIFRYKQYGSRHGMAYCTNSEYIARTYNPSWYQSDDVHPTDTAELSYCSPIIECLLNGSCDVFKTETITSGLFITRDGSIPITDCVDFTIEQHNNITTITPITNPGTPSFKCQYLTTPVPQAEGDVAIFAKIVNSNLIKCMRDDVYPSFPINVLLTGNSTLNCAGMAQIKNERLYVAAFQDASRTPNDYTSMSFFMPTITIPTDYC